MTRAPLVSTRPPHSSRGIQPAPTGGLSAPAGGLTDQTRGLTDPTGVQPAPSGDLTAVSAAVSERIFQNIQEKIVRVVGPLMREHVPSDHGNQLFLDWGF